MTLRPSGIFSDKVQVVYELVLNRVFRANVKKICRAIKKGFRNDSKWTEF